MIATAIARWLPPFAVAALALGVAASIVAGVAASTLGYDYHAYANAAHRLLDGARLYDPSVSVAGGFAIYLYPPPFALAMISFALLPGDVGLWAWLAGLVAAFVLGVAVLPVRREVRWTVVLLAALSWPFLYSVKLGQVGPLLFLAFAVGWRALRQAVPLGVSIAVGALVKVQPALLFGWAVATQRRRAFAVGAAGCVAAAAAATPFIALGGWWDYIDLLRRVSTPVTTPHNFTPGAIAFQMGATEGLANAVEGLTLVAALVVAVWAWFRTDAETSYVTTVVASQLLSPLLWDHYAMLLLIPTALLLERRQWWAVVLPLAGWLPAPVYPFLFGVGLVGPIVVARRPREAASPVARSSVVNPV